MPSLFSRRGDPHVEQDALVAIALVGPDAVPGAAEHVRTCPDCADRLRAVEAAVADDRESTAAEADRIFTPARLARQQAGIARRLGRTAASGRVLWFPGAAAAPSTPHRHVLRRSVAAAALVGLVVGAAAGRLLDPYGRGAATASRDASGSALRSTPAEQLRASAGADEAFLRDFEAAVLESRLAPLQTLDALTPHGADLRSGR